jgi:sugar-specific transcriptional regulator TrmB
VSTPPPSPNPDPARAGDEDLLKRFKSIGFTEYEARVYIQLLRASPATAYEIAKASGVPRPNTYNALDTLAKRGAVQPVSDNPRRYVAAPPQTHLDAIARETASVCEDLAERLARLGEPADDPYVWNVQGEEAIHEKIDALIRDSATSVRAKAARDVLAPHKAALAAAAARGVEMLLILFGDDPDEFRMGETCRVYLHENTGVRMGSADNLFTMTIDRRTALTAATDNLTAFYTRNHAVVQMAETLIRHDYYMAEIHARFGAEIDAAFGPHLRDLRLASFSPEQARSFRAKTGL